MAEPKDDIQDFLKDEYFVQWVLRSDEKSDAYWKQWMRRHPDKLKQIRLAREMITSLAYQQNHQLSPEMYERMFDAITVEQHNMHDSGTSAMRRRWWRRIAACLLLMAGGLTVWHLRPTGPLGEKEAVSFVIKRTQKGEKRIVRLPDGTQIKLNANSVLVYPEVFDDHRRQVQLEGEALFAVAKDADRPFTIISGDVRTQVLGTTFNIRAYEGESDVAVAVVSGKVKVQGNVDEVYLLPNEVSYYHKTDSSLTATSQDISDLIAWSKNILIFDEDPAEEVWKKLENWYGVDIIVPDMSVIKGNYSGRYYNEPLYRVLDGISYASEFVYEIQENNKVLIKEMPMRQQQVR